MIVVFALALMVVPLVVLYVCENAAKKGGGPLADPARMPVLDGMTLIPPMVPMVMPMALVGAEPADPESVFADSRDAERCATESRLVRRLLDGELDRARYHAEMAALAVDAGEADGGDR